MRSLMAFYCGNIYAAKDSKIGQHAVVEVAGKSSLARGSFHD